MGRTRTLESKLKRAVTERDDARRKVLELRRYKERNDELESRLQTVESDRKEEKAELEAKRSESAELAAALRKEKAESEAKDSEMEWLRRQLAELSVWKGKRESLNFHIPLKDNRLYGEPSHTKTLDETECCFLDPERRIGCLHLHLDIKGETENMTIRRKTRMMGH